MSRSSPLVLNLPSLPAWLARLGGDPAVRRRFMANPMLFASWYAQIGSLLTWPEAAQELVRTERAKKLSLERALSLLSRMNYALGDGLDVEQARRVLEGYALHDWVQRNVESFEATLIQLHERMKLAQPHLQREFEDSRLGMVSRLLGLNATEAKVLELALACTALPELRGLLEQLLRHHRDTVSRLGESMLDAQTRDLANALSSQSVLRKSRLLTSTGDEVKLPALSRFWTRLLAQDDEPLFAQLLKPLVVRRSAGVPARLDEEDLELASQILAKANEPGVNLLLYGADGLEKQALLHQLLERSGKLGFVLQDLDEAWKDYPSVVYVAQRVLHSQFGSDAVLVVERPADVLERQPSEFLRRMFGLELDASHIAPFDELVLSTNPGPVVWAGPGVSSLPEECVARFVFHAGLRKARKEERQAQLQEAVQGLKLSKATQETLLQLEGVSALQLETALRAARLVGAASRKEREAHLVRAVKRSLKALQRDVAPVAKECVTEYSLKYVNHAGRFGPEQIMKALKLRPKGSLCLYGPPGTGKTQFVEHLAQQLGRRLLIKRASDLLSKWVGESEQNIAKMFAEAESEDAILFLDEGDSFLRDRSLAQQSWEVTKVNELLQHMERFTGIFVVATNLFQGLDAAALRRFTFKLEFRALHPDQRWEMFVVEAGLKGKLGTLSAATREKWWETLCFMPQLTAGDFATVKRQCILLDESLTPEQWLEQLGLECAAKSQTRQGQDAPRLA